MFAFCAAFVTAKSGFLVGAMYNHGVEFVRRGRFGVGCSLDGRPMVAPTMGARLEWACRRHCNGRENPSPTKVLRLERAVCSYCQILRLRCRFAQNDKSWRSMVAPTMGARLEWARIQPMADDIQRFALMIYRYADDIHLPCK